MGSVRYVNLSTLGRSEKGSKKKTKRNYRKCQDKEEKSFFEIVGLCQSLVWPSGIHHTLRKCRKGISIADRVFTPIVGLLFCNYQNMYAIDPLSGLNRNHNRRHEAKKKTLRSGRYSRPSRLWAKYPKLITIERAFRRFLWLSVF